MCVWVPLLLFMPVSPTRYLLLQGCWVEVMSRDLFTGRWWYSGISALFFWKPSSSSSRRCVSTTTNSSASSSVLAAGIAAQAAAADPYASLAAGVSTGLAALGAGVAVSGTGAAAIGAIAEKPEALGRSLIFVGLAEGVAIYGL